MIAVIVERREERYAEPAVRHGIKQALTLRRTRRLGSVRESEFLFILFSRIGPNLYLCS